VNQKNQVKEKREGAPLIFVLDFLFGISKKNTKKTQVNSLGIDFTNFWIFPNQRIFEIVNFKLKFLSRQCELQPLVGVI